ncbi:Rieske (2Fe-2S) protein [Alphaproteobacteria bacterium KMM 3653]|uniref:Rieske (2Fe-2S) protein n=1 Tax=Harenicola maris TaxID=2841044 RepID=A0AAP2CPK6_9RHOB|nr:Rieske (2Fe-2S) protein [Harenicola maris]
MDYTDFPGAPAPGTPLCALDTLPDGGTKCFEIGGFPVVALRRGADAWAFVNACPHQFLPLNTRSDALLTQDGTALMCSNHNASFDAQTGQGAGICAGQALAAIPVTLADGQLTVA